MKKFSLLVVVSLILLPASLPAQSKQVVLPYLSGGYLYQFVKSNSTIEQTLGFISPTASESGYLTGSGAFGTLNNTSSPPCLLNDTAHVKTFWPSSRDLILRKHISLPNGARNLKVSIALNNAVRAWINGKEVTNGVQTHNTCPTLNGDVVVSVPDSLVKSGDNVLAVLGIWISSKNYLDNKVTCDLPFTITASAGPNGSISPSGMVLIFPGASRTFTMSANAGYHVQTLTVDGVPSIAATSSSTPATLTYTFSNDSSNHSISATFSPNTYTITATAGNNGSISPAGSVIVGYLGNQTFSFIPSTGYHVDSVIVDGVRQPSGPSYSFVNDTSNHTIRVTFAINQYTITASAGANGTISPAGSVVVNYGSNQTFNFLPSRGYHVDSVIVDGIRQTSSPNYTFAHDTANHSIRVTFAINQYVIIATAGPNGSITPNGADTVNYGSTANFLIQANPSYHVDSLQIDGNPSFSVSTSPSTPTQLTYSFQNDTANHTITATFARNKYTLVVTVDSVIPTGNTSLGSVIINPVKALYNPGDTVVLTALTAKGYHFVEWVLPDSSLPTANPLTLTMDANKSIKALFASNVLQTIVVNTFSDETAPNDGLTSLREAINIANGNPGGDTVAFDVTVGNAPGTKIITLLQPLPVFNNPIILDFSSLLDGTGKPTITIQPGYAPGSFADSDGIDLAKNFLRWGYTPQGSIIRGLKIMGFRGSAICLMSDSNIIQQNVITGNGLNGVCIEDGNGNVVGNALNTPGQNRGNIIYLNGRNGITAKDSNPNDSIPPPAGNTFLGNSMYANGQLGIDLGDDGVTPNRYQGGPTNPLIRPLVADAVNFRVNFPTIDIATVAGIDSSQIQGYLLSWRSTPFRVEVYLDDSSNSSGYGEGKTLIGSAQVVTNPDSAYAWFVVTSSIPLHYGQVISATATDQLGNTSEFSRDFVVGVETRIFQPDQYVINTTLSGIPLHWPDGRGSFSFANSILTSGFQAPVESSFVAWNYQALRPDNSPILSYAKVPPVVSTEQWGGYPDGVNNVVWVTNNWEQVTGAPPGAIAVTRVRYNAFNGEMTDVDVAFNAQDFIFGDALAPGAPAGIKDMRDAATHEAGHFGGLGDIYVPGYVGWDIRMGNDNDSLTMYGIIRDNETLKRSLAQGDINGINYIYSHVPKSSVDLVMLIDGSAGFQSKYDGFNPSKMTAMEQVQRLRPNDRVAVIKLPDTLVVPLTKIDSTNLQGVLNAINAISPGGTSSIGAGLRAGLNALNVANPNRPAMILFSAGEETGSPTTLSVVPSLIAGSVPVFTFGFAASTGQALSSQLADTTGGAYYLVADTTISAATHQIWNLLTGFQQLGDTGVFAGQTGIKWQGGIRWQGGIQWQGGINWQGGIQWQGAVDPGATSILPGINWQGSTFVLFLVPPGFPVPTGITDSSTLPSYVITPSNLPKGATYVQGPNYAFYKLPVPAPGKWTLFPVGANTTPPPPNPEPVGLNLIATTDVILAVSFDHATYSPGSVVQIQAILSEGGTLIGTQHLSGGQPITNGVVTATVTLPGTSIPQVVTLTHVGNGVYKGTFSNTQTPGTYDFKIQATGTTPTLPQGFNRESEQSVFVAPVYLNAVVFAKDSVIFSDSTSVLSGSVLVNRKSQPGDPGVELSIGHGVTTPAGYNLKADRINIRAGSIINSDVYYNQLSDSGTINGKLNTPLTLPLGQFPPFITADSTTETAPGFTLGNGQQGALQPGIYGDVVLQPGSNLAFVSGIYQLRTLWLKSGSVLSCIGTSQVQIRVRRGLQMDNGTVLGPGNGSALAASDILIYIAGTDAQSGFGYSADISPKSIVSANMYAANGTIYLNQLTTAKGAFLGRIIRTGSGIKFSLASAFNASPSSSRTRVNSDGENSAPATGVPASFQLMQNYPNPFNPTTVIRYALPRQAYVTLSIYNILGQEIARLVDQAEAQGYYEVTWDSRNAHGASVSSGLYFYRLTAGGFTDIKKMMLIK